MQCATQFTSLASSEWARQSVYRLRYDCYRREESIEPNPVGVFIDRFDSQPNHFSFLQYQSALPHATVRVSVVRPDLDWRDSPARIVYGDHPAFRKFAGSSYVEPNRLCFAPRASRQGFIELLGSVAALAELCEVEWLIACPRLDHAHLYQNLFGFQPQAEPRQFFGVKLTAQLMAVSLSQLRAYIQYDDRMLDSWVAALGRLRKTEAPPPFPVQEYPRHA